MTNWRRLGAALSGMALVVIAAGAAPAHAAGKPICVGVVVDPAGLGHGVSSGCAKVQPGASGIDVLEAAGHKLVFRSDGLICSIDALPANGCAGVDDHHYWAYFRRAPGSSRWTYSTLGPASTRPAANSAEGWVFGGGSQPPPDIAQSRLCPPASAATPSPKPTHRRSPQPAASRATHRPTPTATPSKSRAPRHRAGAGPATHHRRHVGRTTGSSDAYTSTLHLSFSPTPRAATEHSKSSGHGGLIGLIVGVAVVAALGGAAVIRSRRST
ncbi:MAG TPA: hypothetical protein VG708_03235 [Mycobacteriales bacterium]|nr:hypothetical protein [Mycobacteriales bacterium]